MKIKKISKNPFDIRISLNKDEENEAVDLLKELIKIPSASGEEKDIGFFISNKMEKLGFDKIIDLMNQICEGLLQAHQAEIVHRDLKPENIIAGRDGRVRILDFGLAKLKGVSKLTKESSTIGTVHYMSPEQIQGKYVDHRSDIWSLGVLLYEMLTGEVPFHGEYEQAVTYAILNEEPESITSLINIIPDELNQIVCKCMKKNPNERYQQAGELQYHCQCCFKR